MKDARFRLQVYGLRADDRVDADLTGVTGAWGWFVLTPDFPGGVKVHDSLVLTCWYPSGDTFTIWSEVR